MKNAIALIFFQIIILIIYFYFLFLSKNEVQKETIAANNISTNHFKLSKITNNGDEFYIEGKSLERNGAIRVATPKGYIKFNKKNDVVHFVGDNLETDGDSHVVLKGNAKLSMNNDVLISDVVIVDVNNKILSSPTASTYFSSYGQLKCSSFIYNLSEKELKLKNIEGKLWLKTA